MESINILEILKQNWYIAVIFAVVIVVSIIFNIARAKKIKGSNNKFLESHPDAAKVYLTQKALVTSEVVQVYTVNGAHPETFLANGKTGFYLIPGESTVSVSFTYSRPGVLHKNVTTTYGPMNKTLVVQPNKSYLFSFDRKEEQFIFSELSETE